MKITNKFKAQLYNYFISRLGGYRYRRGWMRIPTCPYCGREHKLGVNLSMYRTNCFRCNAHPSPAQLIMDIEGFTEYHELINFLNNGQFDELQFKEEKIELAESKPMYLPKGFRNISLGDSQLAKSIRGYIKKRGFSVDQFSRYGIGYGTMGETYGYLIIPFYYHGQLKYYNARNVIGKGPRYNNPDKDITGLGKQFIIFNHDALEMYRSVFVCEGALNALTMGDRGIATMGKVVSKYQLNELIKAPCQRYIILLDFDAQKYAIELALKLILYKKVKLVLFEDNRDVNDLGKKAVLKKVYKTKYTTYQDLIKLKNSL